MVDSVCDTTVRSSGSLLIVNLGAGEAVTTEAVVVTVSCLLEAFEDPALSTAWLLTVEEKSFSELPFPYSLLKKKNQSKTKQKNNI